MTARPGELPPAPAGPRPAGPRAGITARTLRTDRWWVGPAVSAAVLFSFVVYATWRAFENAHYYASPYLSPFYSPCVATNCAPGSDDFGRIIGGWWQLSPALLILVFPLGFRMSCYYYRRAYYRAFWLSPPACAVAEPHRRYTGETRFPLIFQNAHRWFLAASLAFNVVLTWDALLGFRNARGEWGHAGLGTLVLLANAALLWLYSLSCHSCRHVIGGRLTHFSRHPYRYRAWTAVSRLNARHPQFAWASLVGVAVADQYVRLLAAGTITDLTFF